MSAASWGEYAVPILGVVAESEAWQGPSLTDVRDALPDLDPDAVALECQRLLNAGFLTGSEASSFEGFDVVDLHLAERGLREIGVWPAFESHGLELLVNALDERLAATSDPDERSKLSKLKDAVLGAGQTIVTNVLTEAAKNGLGL